MVKLYLHSPMNNGKIYLFFSPVKQEGPTGSNLNHDTDDLNNIFLVFLKPSRRIQR
jgi:hypothetical protein